MNKLPSAIPAPQEPPFIPLGLALSDENKLQLLEYWRSMLRRRWIILGIALAAALLAGAFAYSMNPVYRSSATVLIEAGKPKVLSIEEVYSSASQEREHYQTQVEILRSREVAKRTVIATRLWEHEEFDPRREHGLQSHLAWLFGSSAAAPGSSEESLAEGTVDRLSAALKIEPVRLSQLVRVSFEAEDRELAARVANAAAQMYIEADRDARFSLTQQISGWLQERMGGLREKLVQSEQALQAYREKQGLVDLSGSAQSVAGQQIGEITGKLVAARVKRTELESAYEQIQRISNGDYSGVPAVVNHPAVGEARSRVAAARLKVQDLDRNYGAQHTRMIEAQTELASARGVLFRQTRAVIDALTREYQAAQQTEQALQAALGSARGTVQDVNRQEFELAVLQRDVESNRQLYELFTSRAKETKLASDVQIAVARVVDPASPAGAPVRPDKTQIVVLALLLGLLAGCAGSLLLDKLDNTLKGSDEAEHRLRQPVLASLPAITTSGNEPLTRLFLEQPQSLHAEAIRTARTGVLLSSIDVDHKLLLVTSSGTGEGKTTLCTNLAFAHAQTKRTLLIDADMRRPQIGQRLGLPSGAKGLSNLVSGTAEPKDCLHTIAGSNLLVMPAGDIPPNPQELLLSQRFRDALASLSEQVEVIVIDSPPVEMVSDALVIAPQVSSVIYVVKALDTPHPHARKGIMRLQRAGAKILGVVLNQLDLEGSGRYGRRDAARYAYLNPAQQA